MRILPEAAEVRGSASPAAGSSDEVPDARIGAGGLLGHRNDIQGLRALAVLLVVLGHAGVPFLTGGFVGVDVFFVLSGFLITGLLLDGAGKRGYVSLKDFYARRAKRILPAAALTLIVTDIVAERLLNVVRAKQAVLDSIWAALFSANIRLAHQGVDYFARSQPPSPIQHYWSLAVEEQFYLVWPLLLSVVLIGVAIGRRRRPSTTPRSSITGKRRLAVAIVIIGLASLAWSIYDTPRTPAAAYFSTAARAWELALGAALAIGASRFVHLSDGARAAAGWAGVLAIGAAAVLFSERTAFPGYAALLPTVGTAAVIAAGIGNERTRRGVGGVLGRRPLRYVGDRSYAFYLWHWPVLVIAAYYVGHSISIGANLMLLAGAFLLSMLSYGLMENPIRRAKLRRPIRTSALLWGTSVGLVVLVAGFNLRSISAVTAASEAGPAGPIPTLAPYSPTPQAEATDLGDPASWPAIPAVVAAVQAAQRGESIPSSLLPPVSRLLDDRYDFPSTDCYAKTGAPTGPGPCVLGTTGATRTIVVFGDSHVRQWMPAISWVASQDGWRIVPLVELGCGPSEYAGGCNAYFQWAVQQVQAMRPEVVLIGGHLRTYSADAKRRSAEGIAMLIDAMKPLAGSVVVIGDPPGQGLEPVDCLLGRGATLATCTWTLTDDQTSLYQDVAEAARTRGVGFIDAIAWFCFEAQCPMVIDHTIAYRDTDHITRTYVLELRELFRDAFTRALS